MAVNTLPDKGNLDSTAAWGGVPGRARYIRGLAEPCGSTMDVRERRRRCAFAVRYWILKIHRSGSVDLDGCSGSCAVLDVARRRFGDVHLGPRGAGTRTAPH